MVGMGGLGPFEGWDLQWGMPGVGRNGLTGMAAEKGMSEFGGVGVGATGLGLAGGGVLGKG